MRALVISGGGSKGAFGGGVAQYLLQEKGRGATEIDVVILETEVQLTPKSVGRNPFSLMIDLFQILLNQVEKHDITIGKLAAKNKNVKLNLYYTPTHLTNNALIFDKLKMKKWWDEGYQYAKNKSETMSDNLPL